MDEFVILTVFLSSFYYFTQYIIKKAFIPHFNLYVYISYRLTGEAEKVWRSFRDLCYCLFDCYPDCIFTFFLFFFFFKFILRIQFATCNMIVFNKFALVQIAKPIETDVFYS